MLNVGNRGFSHFSRDCWKSFPGRLLDMPEVQQSGHFQMSNSISIKVSIANI